MERIKKQEKAREEYELERIKKQEKASEEYELERIKKQELFEIDRLKKSTKSKKIMSKIELGNRK